MPSAVTKPVAVALGTPQDIAVALVGAETVTLRGFSAEPLPPTWIRPDVNFVTASIGPTDLMRQDRRRRRKALAMVVIALIALQLALLSAMAFVRSTPFSTNTGQAWHVTNVQARGVVLATGGGAGKPPITTFVEVGGRLPTGEVLQSTVPDKNAYVTNSTTVVLRTSAR